MSEDTPASDKPHEATPEKLRAARRKGEIARSPELNSAIALLALTAALIGMGPWFVGVAMERLPLFFTYDFRALADHGALGPARMVVWSVLLPVFVVLAVAPLCVVVWSVVMRQILWSPSSIAPKVSRLSLIKNAKNKFGATEILRFCATFAKLCILSALLGVLVFPVFERIFFASQGSVGAGFYRMLLESRRFLLLFCAIFALFGGLDFFLRRRKFLAQNRMTQEELKREVKNSEGDPTQKHQRRARAQALIESQSVARVPEASVVIVNPTHFAVALKWTMGDLSPPVCVAKGQDGVALRIRQIASRHGIAVFSDPPTARGLYAAIEIGQPIPRAHFKAVAAAIRFAQAPGQGGGT